MTVEDRRERNRLYNIKWREKNKEKVKQSQKTFDEKHPGRRTTYQKNYMVDYRKTKVGRAHQLLCGYREKDKKYDRGDTTITKDWIIDNIFTSSCTYCGESDWMKLGCDRIDNNKPHTPDNVVCSCKSCNSDRQYKGMSVEEYVEHKKGTAELPSPHLAYNSKD